jgi:hypothetical protein
MQLRRLPGTNFLRLVWVRRKQTQLAPFAKYDQLALYQDGGPTAIDRWLP